MGESKDGWRNWDLELGAGEDPADLLQACTDGAFPLRRFQTREPSLHEIFLHLVSADQETRS